MAAVVDKAQSSQAEDYHPAPVRDPFPPGLAGGDGNIQSVARQKNCVEVVIAHARGDRQQRFRKLPLHNNSAPNHSARPSSPELGIVRVALPLTDSPTYSLTRRKERTAHEN